MKTYPAIIVGLAACAASAYVGYTTGQKNASAADSAGAPAKQAAKPIKVAFAPATLDSLLHGPGVPDADALAQWAKSLSAQDCADALAKLQTMKGGAARDAVIAAVLASWAKSDPQGMLGASGQVRSPKLRENGMDVALKNWAAKDPAAALQWLKDNPGTASTSASVARYAAAIAGFAATDAKGAFDTVAALNDSDPHDRELKTEALKALTDTLTADGRFSDALQMYATLPAGEIRNGAMDGVAEKWAAAAPDDAAAWAVTISDPAERLRLEEQVANTWAASDPASAADWAMQLDKDNSVAKSDPNDPTSGPGMLLANAILAWSKYDLDGPADYLNGLPNSPNKDRAVAVFAMHAAEEDPESAVKWLGTISDKRVRSGVTLAVAVQMYQQDPATFNNFIDTTDVVDDSERQGMKQMMPLISTSMAMISSMTGGKVNFLSTMMDGMLTGKASPLTNQIRQMQQQMQQRANRGGGAAPGAPAGASPPPAQ